MARKSRRVLAPRLVVADAIERAFTHLDEMVTYFIFFEREVRSDLGDYVTVAPVTVDIPPNALDLRCRPELGTSQDWGPPRSVVSPDHLVRQAARKRQNHRQIFPAEPLAANARGLKADMQLLLNRHVSRYDVAQQQLAWIPSLKLRYPPCRLVRKADFDRPVSTRLDEVDV